MKRPQPQPQQPAAAALAAAAEQTMALFDACWFRRLVLLPSPTAAPPPAASSSAAEPRTALPSQQQAAPLEREVDVDTTHAPQRPSPSPTAGGGGLRHRRTRSDEATAFQGRLEPLRLPDSGNRARLETILSGKDGLVVAAAPQPLPETRRRPELARRPAAHGPGRRRRRRGRSMSELEFEEVKGLQDLGFTFSDAEVDAELASIVPGLLRRKRSEEETTRATASAPAATTTSSSARRSAEAINDDDDASAAAQPRARRPYLSEAWDDEEEAEVRRALRNWRIPPAGDGDQLKEHLRMWAHTVASAVR